MAPHDVQPAHRLELGEVKDGLGSDGRGETARDVDFFETAARAQPLALNQVGKALVAQLLFRKRLRPKGDAEVGKARAVLPNYGDRVVVTKITANSMMNIMLPRESTKKHIYLRVNRVRFGRQERKT